MCVFQFSIYIFSNNCPFGPFLKEATRGRSSPRGVSLPRASIDHSTPLWNSTALADTGDLFHSIFLDEALTDSAADKARATKDRDAQSVGGEEESGEE